VALASFVGWLDVRVPRFRESVERCTADAMRQITLTSAMHPEYFERKMREASAAQGKAPPEDIERVRQFILSGEYELRVSPIVGLRSMVQLASTAIDYVLRCQWRVLEAPAGNVFATSDAPLVRISIAKLFLDALNAIPGIRCQRPKGAFYVFPNVAGLCERLGLLEAYEALPPDMRAGTSPSRLLQSCLLGTYGVATVDRNSFGRIGADGQHFLRLSIATSLDDCVSESSASRVPWQMRSAVRKGARRRRIRL
jgi:hypothetical protein